MSTVEEKTGNVFGATLTRRKFVKGSGALVVGLSLPAAFMSGSAAGGAIVGTQLDPTAVSSWLTINADNTILMRTGRAEMGQGSASTAFAQIMAEELEVPYAAITQVVMASTDRTPDGGVSAGFLFHRETDKQIQPFGAGALNIQLVAAYTKQALLALASTTLGVPVANLTVKDGVVSGGGKNTTYGQLVQGQQLNLTIPTTGTPLTGVVVTGNPPTKPVSQYKVVGQSIPMRTIPGLVTGTAVYVANVKLPGLLEARMVKPPTLGSTLVSVGALDKKQFPNSQVVVKGNLVGVVSTTDWEAIAAASQVAGKTKWTDWQGLPGNGNLFSALEKVDSTGVPVTVGTNVGAAGAALATAAKKLAATYTLPYVKHGPIGPSVVIGDVRSDGITHIHTHTQAAQALRNAMALMLSTDPKNVVVHWYEGSGHYGRSNGGIEGAEADAVILSQAVGKPVRVQWMRPEDMIWSTSSYGTYHKVQAGLDASGNLVAFQADYMSPGTKDERPIGALLAGLPHGVEPTKTVSIATQWAYDKVPNVLEQARGGSQIGQDNNPLQVGLRVHSMRTPGHRQQNFALEGMINEAAAAAGVDPIEYRLRHTTKERVINLLQTLKKEHGWQTRPSPNPEASATGSKPVFGHGTNLMIRFNGYWASAVDLTVTPSTGRVTLQKYTLVAEVGIAVNPRQLTRNMEGGTIQGISEAMLEEFTFNKSVPTGTDWVKYPILRMRDMPEIKTVIINRPDLNVTGMGGEAPNALPLQSIAAAFFDATGIQARTLPLRPANVRALLKT
jgi:nicotinate dehydrogenase subunit B